MKVLSFGEILWDCYPDKKYIGGAPLNFASHLAMHGEEVYALSAVGADSLGAEAKKIAEERKISSKYISVLSDKPTGKCVVTLDKNSVPEYNLLSDTAYDYISCDDIADEYDVLYFGTLALRSEYNRNSLGKLLCEKSFKEIFVDVNLRKPFYTAETVKFAVQNATILKISLEELAETETLLGIRHFDDYKAFAKELAKRYEALRCIIITCGADGAYALDCTCGEEYSCAGKPTVSVSTVGAGDSFSAAFLSLYMKKHGISECLEYAAELAAYVVSNYDAVPDYKNFEKSL